LTLVDYSVPSPGPTANTPAFPTTKASAYWSSTVAGAEFVWSVNFSQGLAIALNGKFDAFHVRCVRGAQTPGPALFNNGNGTVTDLRTALMWQQGHSNRMNWTSALAYCEGLDLGGSTSWRLPNTKEHSSLTDDTRRNPALDTSLFPAAGSEDFWSSTTNPKTGSAWAIMISEGWVINGYKHHSNLTRCVADRETGARGPIFHDDFTDGAAAVDWLRLSGTWTAAGSVYAAASARRNNLARIVPLDPGTLPLGAGIVSAKIKLTSRASRSGPNGVIVFGLRNAASYRWMRVTTTTIAIGQTGIIDGIFAGAKKRVAKRQALNRFALYRVEILPDGRVNVYKGTSSQPALSYRFIANGLPSVAPGGIGLGAAKAKTLFDDVTVWEGPAPAN